MKQPTIDPATTVSPAWPFTNPHTRNTLSPLQAQESWSPARPGPQTTPSKQSTTCDPAHALHFPSSRLCTYLWGFTAIPRPLIARSPLHCPCALPCPALPCRLRLIPSHRITGHHSKEVRSHATLHVFHTSRVAPSIQLPRFCQSQTQYFKGLQWFFSFFLIKGGNG